MVLRRAFLVLLLLAVASLALLLARTVVNAEPIQTNMPVEKKPAAIAAEDWLRIIKSPSPANNNTAYVSRGEAVRFVIVVINTNENAAMRDVVVVDELTPECSAQFALIGPNEREYYECTHLNVQESFTNVASVAGINVSSGNINQASDSADVELLELATGLAPLPEQIIAPGGLISFTVTITNSGSTGIKLTSLSSTQFGDVDDPQNSVLLNNGCASSGGLPILAPDSAYQCAFSTEVLRLPGSHPFDIRVEGVVSDNTDVQVASSGETAVTIYELITATLTSNKNPVPSGGRIELGTTIVNLSESKDVTIVALEDSTLGDIRAFGDCQLPQILVPGGTYSCQYGQLATEPAEEQQLFFLDVFAETNEVPPKEVTFRASTSVGVIEPIIHLPVIAHIPKPTSCSSALYVELNTDHQFFHDNMTSFYRFSLDKVADVTVELSDFQTVDGQITVFKDLGGGCSNLQRIGHNGNTSSEMPVPLGLQQPGDYYVRVVNFGDLLADVPYTLQIVAKQP